MHDVGGQPVFAPIVHQARQDTGGDDAAAAEHHHQVLGARGLVDVLVLLVRAHHVVEILMSGAELLQFWQEPQARVADGEVNEFGAVGQPLGRG